MEKDYVHTVLHNNVPVQDYFTGNIYSPLVGSKRTNPISYNSHPYDPSSSMFHSWMLPNTSIQSNRDKIDSKYKWMDGLQK